MTEQNHSEFEWEVIDWNWSEFETMTEQNQSTSNGNPQPHSQLQHPPTSLSQMEGSSTMQDSQAQYDLKLEPFLETVKSTSPL